MGTSERGEKVPRTISHARIPAPGRAGHGRSDRGERLLHLVSMVLKWRRARCPPASARRG